MTQKSIYDMTDEEQVVAAKDAIENLDVDDETKKRLFFIPPLAVLVGAAALGVVGGAGSIAGAKIVDRIWPDKPRDKPTP